MSARQEGRRARAEIDIASSGNNTIITAINPGHIEIDHINLIPTGGANTVILRDGSTQIASYAFDDNQGFAFDNASGDAPLTLSNNSAFVINLSAATQVSGFVLYRVLGE